MGSETSRDEKRTTICCCCARIWIPDTAEKSGRFKSYEGVALEYTFLIALAQGTLPGQAAR